jgi:hypothetical protein
MGRRHRYNRMLPGAPRGLEDCAWHWLISTPVPHSLQHGPWVRWSVAHFPSFWMSELHLYIHACIHTHRCACTHTQNWLLYTERIFTLLTGFMAAGAPLAVRCIWILLMNQNAWQPVMFRMKGSSYLCSQITGGVENVVPLHVDFPHTSGRGSDLPFEDVLQEYLQLSYNYFLLVLPFRGYCCKLCHSNNPRRKSHED